MDTFVTYSGWIIGLIAFAFGVWSFFRMKEEREPVCYYKTFLKIENFLDKEEEGLKVFYNNKEVEKVTNLYLFFWNKGKRPIKQEDLRSPIQITFPPDDAIILDYKILKVSREEIGFSLTRCDNGSLQINFDFLDINDGAVINLKHNGADNISPIISGTIIGVPKGVEAQYLDKNILVRLPLLKLLKYAFSMNYLHDEMPKFILYFVGVLLGFWLGLVTALKSIKPKVFWGRDTEWFFNVDRFLSNPIVVVVFIFLLSALTLFILYLIFERSRRLPYPKSLDISITEYH